MMGNYHVPCGAGEKLEITSNAYLLPTSANKTKSVKWLIIIKTKVSWTGFKN